ncbi:hypothetical protein L596_007914 [Steinernema carpocapsae]|uniref:Uncharacterized protein n=1 Tax=Steinernema carpocapsae TaxID=34508 RepID=A0A4U5PB56_STECR|nr:hypothetical protein L596_007914 [Steinernema carpocapsae]
MLAFIAAVFFFLYPKKQFTFFGVFALFAVYTIVVINVVFIVGQGKHHSIDSVADFEESPLEESNSTTPSDTDQLLLSMAAPTSAAEERPAVSFATPRPSAFR